MQKTEFNNKNQHGDSRGRREKCPVVGLLLASAIAIFGIYFAHAEFRLKRMNTETAPRSPAYLFGFAHAALAVCDVSPGPGLDQLAAAVPRDPHGKLLDDIKVGVSDFNRIQQENGTADACRQAERFFGPRARHHPGVLLPR